MSNDENIITTNHAEGGPVGATIFRRVVGAAAVLAVVGVGLLPSAADAASGCSSWGCSDRVSISGGQVYGQVDDIARDKSCVSLWTIDGNGNRVDQIARSCGAASYGKAPRAAGVRMFRDDGRYLTIVAAR